VTTCLTGPTREPAWQTPRENRRSMTAERPVLLRFVLLYCALFGAFGCVSPFLPAFLAGRGLGPEELGVVLGGATALRLVCGPIAGRIADRLHAFRAELGLCAILGASVTIVFLVAHGFWALLAITLFQAAALAPLVPLWSEAVAAEVLVFLLIGTTLLRLIKPTGALACAASCGALRWGVMAQSTDLTALALIQPLHGFTFALLHLASMRLITDTVPSGLAATAQAVYGLVGVGGATAVLIILSGWLYMHYGPAGFWAMALLCIAALPVIWTLHRAVSARTR
jgi:PPP family 3-phenylpropionic acid transporter